MAQSKKTDDESNIELLELSKNRQLFLLNPFTDFIKPKTNITNWEQVTCAGYNPYYQRLEAVVSVKKPNGYNGTLCSNGSLEYVRFFVDFKDGAGFQDMGYTNFKVADISDVPPGPQHPLSYLAFLFIDDKKHRKFLDCDHAVIPTLRAILSWNSVPSTNPNKNPHYGNHIDVNIQLARKPWILWRDFVEVAKIKEFAKLIDPEFEVKLKEPVTEKIDTIYKLNKAASVHDHRTFYSTIGAKLNSTVDFSKATSIFDITTLDNFNIDFNSFYDFFNGAGEKADVGYEELTCVGLNTLTDRLGAVIHVKRPTGFNGNLCTNGSREHVAFWADWNNNGIFDQYLGTVSLNVHDISNIPKDGLYYSVQLPMNVTHRLRQCSNPNIIRIRAVLSWESLPSTTNPNLLNHWGNYKDVLVQLRPAFRPGSGLHSAIYYVGGVDRFSIDPISHLHNAGSASIFNNRPWGGKISFNGIIDRNGFNGIIKYRLLVKTQGAPDTSFQPVSTSETFSLDDIFTVAGAFDDPQTDPNGWYIYKQNPNIGLYNINNYLATWDASTKTDGAYTIRFVHTDEFGNEVIADQFTIIVCNTGMIVSPTANTSVDFGKDLDLVIDGGDCHSYTPGDPTINGHLRAVHPYFAWWSLELQPTSHTHGVNPVPASRTHSSLGDNGDANATWSLDTMPLDPCGYTVSLSAHSRVILNSSPGHFPYYGPKAVGFAKLP
jgi:hypothetical protein